MTAGMRCKNLRILTTKWCMFNTCPVSSKCGYHFYLYIPMTYSLSRTPWRERSTKQDSLELTGTSKLKSPKPQLTVQMYMFDFFHDFINQTGANLDVFKDMSHLCETFTQPAKLTKLGVETFVSCRSLRPGRDGATRVRKTGRTFVILTSLLSSLENLVCIISFLDTAIALIVELVLLRPVCIQLSIRWLLMT